MHIGELCICKAFLFFQEGPFFAIYITEAKLRLVRCCMIRTWLANTLSDQMT